MIPGFFWQLLLRSGCNLAEIVENTILRRRPKPLNIKSNTAVCRWSVGKYRSVDARRFKRRLSVKPENPSQNRSDRVNSFALLGLRRRRPAAFTEVYTRDTALRWRRNDV